MSCDLLLYWMSHMGEGSWTAFRRSVQQLVPDIGDPSGFARGLRVHLSDSGHADFFLNGKQRWRVLPPLVAGLSAENSAVLCGARTPALVQAVQEAAWKAGCEISISDVAECPSHILLSGGVDALASAATGAHIQFQRDCSRAMLTDLETVSSQLLNAPEAIPRLNWDVASFDLAKFEWTEGLLPNAACRFEPRYGSAEFFLHKKHKCFIRMSKRDAVYASAMLQGVSLLTYTDGDHKLTVNSVAPLPERLARIATLCSGNQPEVSRGTFIYTSVPVDVASALMVALGQPNPMSWRLLEPRRKSVG